MVLFLNLKGVRIPLQNDGGENQRNSHTNLEIAVTHAEHVQIRTLLCEQYVAMEYLPGSTCSGIRLNASVSKKSSRVHFKKASCLPDSCSKQEVNVSTLLLGVRMVVSIMKFIVRLCEEVGVVKGVHLHSGEVRSVTTALKVVDEVREEVQEIQDE